MKKTALITGTLMAAIFASSAAMADAPRRPAPPAAPGHHNVAPMFVNVNTNALEKRIDAGAKSGKLTNSEERTLRKELRRLAAAVKAAKQDHRITAWERSNLERKEAQLKRNISKLMNNRAVENRHDNRRDDRRDNNRSDNNRYDNNRR